MFNTLNWFGYGGYNQLQEYEKFIKNQLKNDLEGGCVHSKIVDGNFGDYLPNVKVTNKSTGKIVFSNEIGEFTI